MKAVGLNLLAMNMDALRASARARTRRQKAQVRQATRENLEDEYDIAQTLVPRLTEYLAEHMLHQLTEGGYNYFLGYIRRLFVGQVNRKTKKVVTEPYYEFVTGGTRYMAGNDFLRETRRIMRPRARARYQVALAV